MKYSVLEISIKKIFHKRIKYIYKIIWSSIHKFGSVVFFRGEY
uniref:Uncharacterized protein n=1 Tax=Anguilla anguilla TaxID=7936 RepID=A0A0E9PH47_ANGAN